MKRNEAALVQLTPHLVGGTDKDQIKSIICNDATYPDIVFLKKTNYNHNMPFITWTHYPSFQS